MTAPLSMQPASGRASLSSYSELPLAFEENRGQAPAGVNYVSRTRSGVVLLRPGSLSLQSGEGKTTMRFLGAGTASAPTGEQKLPGITSYLVGPEDDWVRGVPNYARVRYATVYPGIDAVFYGNQKLLEYDFVLHPGADPDQIRIGFEGLKSIAIDANGNLELKDAHGAMKQHKPKVWQMGPHGRRELDGRYVLSGASEVRFRVDSYDRRETLVIDPVIEYSTYFGSTRDDLAQAVATDSTGGVYIAGSTATSAVSWGFVSKMNPGGTAVVYTVYIGDGTCNAGLRGIAVDSGNDAIVAGYYTVRDAAGACGAMQVLGAKLNPAGDAFVYELAWGGTQASGNAVALDTANNAYFTGLANGGFPTTTGVIFPTGGAAGDAFITKLNPTGGLVYSTYLGGALKDEGLALRVDAAGNAYVAGSTSSTSFPTTANAVQATMPNSTETGFVTEVNSTATQILYSTFLGGNVADRVSGIALDAQSKIHVAGTTTSTNFPTTANAWDRTCGTDGACSPYNDGTVHNSEDVFYSKIDPLKAGTAGLVYSTYLGGSKRDFADGIALDKNGYAWLTGVTGSTGDFPTVQATQTAIGGNYDGFVAQIDPTKSGAASLLFSSYLGGSLYDEGTATAVDPLGAVYVVGYTASTNFPVSNAVQPLTAGGVEAFVLKLAPPPAALASIALNPATVTGGANSTGTVKLTAAAPAGGVVVTLASSNTNAATVPASVTIAAGATSATFTITTKIIAVGTVANITATYSGVSKSIGLVVNAPLASITLSPVVLTGGAGSTGTVTLTSAAPAGGAIVTLTSSNTTAATVPASVTVAAGATTGTFTLTTHPVTSVTSVNITAAYNGASKIVTLTVNPPAAIAGLALNPAAVVGGANSTATVTLGAAAPAGGAVVTLASSNTNAVTVPASVTVAAGATTGTFTATSHAVTAATAVTITATFNGVAKTATLTVNPPAAIAGLTLNPAAVAGGANSTATVTLGGAAPAGGAVVTLASSNINAATVPASVTVAAGATTGTFTITSHAVTAVTAVTLTATYNGVAKTATLTVNPPATLAGLTIAPAVIIYGNSATGTVTLTSAAPAGGAVVALAQTSYLEFTVPASVTIPAGATNATFTIGSSLFASNTTISATYNGVTKTANLTSVDPSVVAMACAPNPVIAGTTTICTVTLNGIMPWDTTVWILSDQPFFAPASGMVTVPAGANSTRFSITTTIVPEPIVAHISANALATATVTVPLTINLTNRGKKWVLNNVVFKDGGTASGYFTYDAATGTYLDANITTTPGPDPGNPLGKSPGNLYYYPWPNGFNPTILDNWSTPSLLSLQTPDGAYVDPVTGGSIVVAWTVLQLNFPQPLTNAGGTINLAINPNVAYSSYCVDNIPALCTPPPTNISQEQFAMPPNPYIASSGFYFRTVVSGTITAQ